MEELQQRLNSLGAERAELERLAIAIEQQTAVQARQTAAIEKLIEVLGQPQKLKKPEVDWLPTKEAAKQLHMQPSTLRTKARQRELRIGKDFQPRGNHYLFNVESCQEWLCTPPEEKGAA